MNIKNTLLFSFLFITHYNINAMDASHDNQKEKTEPQTIAIHTKYTQEQLKSKIEKNEKKRDNAWNIYIKTDEYQLLEETKKSFSNNSAEKLSLVSEYSRRAYQTKESQEYRKLNETLKSLQRQLENGNYIPAEVQCMTPLNMEEPIYLLSKTTQSLNQKISKNDNAQKEIKQTTYSNNNNNNSQPPLNIQNSNFYGIKESVNIMATSKFQAITQTPKFQAIIQKPEFFIMMQTPQFQNFIKAISLQSSNRIQEALEELLETEAIQLIFEAGILSDTIREKFNAMQKTESYDDYQAIKDYHTIWNTPDSQKTLNDYRETWRSTKEYKELLDAANAEMFLNNSTQKEAKLNNNNNSNSYPNTETSLSNAEIAFLNMAQTQQYQAYDQANKLHIKYNKPKTKILLEEALGLLLQTQESKTLLQINNQEKTETNNSQSYSEDVVKKNNAMIATVEWQRFQQAKANYEQNPSEDTKYIFTLYKEDLHATKECQDFIKATGKEAHITNNITNAKKWEAEQSHLNCQSIESMQIKRDNAWKIVQNTEEYKLFKQIKLANELNGTFETQTLLRQCEHQAKKTPEYIHYFKIDQQLRTIKGQPRTNNNRYIQNNNNNNNT